MRMGLKGLTKWSSRALGLVLSAPVVLLMLNWGGKPHTEPVSGVIRGLGKELAAFTRRAIHAFQRIRNAGGDPVGTAPLRDFSSQPPQVLAYQNRLMTTRSPIDLRSVDSS